MPHWGKYGAHSAFHRCMIREEDDLIASPHHVFFFLLFNARYETPSSYKQIGSQQVCEQVCLDFTKRGDGWHHRCHSNGMWQKKEDSALSGFRSNKQQNMEWFFSCMKKSCATLRKGWGIIWSIPPCSHAGSNIHDFDRFFFFSWEIRHTAVNCSCASERERGGQKAGGGAEEEQRSRLRSDFWFEGR